MSTAPAPRPYPLDNAHELAAEHHAALAGLLDGDSRRRITGLRELAGARVLEVGAGGGSMATWLTGQVGTAGSVTAADLNPTHLRPQPRLRVVTADVSQHPQRWPAGLAGAYDLIYSRLTLKHLPARQRIVTALVDRLAPGGHLLVEDWGERPGHVVIDAPTPADAERYERYQRCAAEVFVAGGSDHRWAPGAHRVLRELGLTDVDTVVTSRYWTAGSPGLRLVTAVAIQLRTKLLHTGLGADDLDQLGDLLDHPRLIVHGHPMYSTSARKPAGA